MSNKHLAFLGGGNMARALISGLLRQGTRPELITVGESSATARDSLAADLGVQATADNARALESAEVVVLAVKPQVAGDVLAPLRPVLQLKRPLLISVAAGIRVEALQTWAGTGVPVVRSMPNRPAFVGAGATGLFAPGSVAEPHRQLAERTLQAVGEVVWVPSEDNLDVVTALSGSGPAYFFLLTELMTQSAVELGLEPTTARTLAIATLAGSGQLARAGDGDLAKMRAEVTSKGGTTEAAIKTFEAADLKNLVWRALEAATRRSQELAQS